MSPINKSDILRQLKDQYSSFLEKDLRKALDMVFDNIADALKKGHSCEIRSFGRFSTKIIKAGYKRNPRTGERIFKEKSLKVFFRPSKNFKELINKKENE